MRNLSKRSVSLDFIRRDDHCQGGRLSLDDRAFGAGQNSISDQAAVSSESEKKGRSFGLRLRHL